MKLSIRSSALLVVLVPTLISALALSAGYTRLRVGDARTELESRGARESGYLADASELALLVGDSETLQRLAASNLKGADSAAAVLFLDDAGALLAAAGSVWEIGLARQCWLRVADCSGGEQRYLFQRDVRSRANGDDSSAFGATESSHAESGKLLGSVVLSFDPRHLAAIQRAMLLNSLGITLATLLFAALAAQFFSSRLSEPMQRLSSVVARIRSGELGARTTPGGAGELRDLEEGVNAMADRVEAASAELNRRVDEATAETSFAMIDLEQRNRELDKALERAADASRAKDLFLARMSHELRTPLTTVTGYARFMHQSESREQRADFYHTIEQASGILLATVDDILDFVKLESGQLHLEQREFDFETCVEDAVMMQAPHAHQKGLELVCHVGAGLAVDVIGDSLRLSQVLANLVSNAIKFTAAGAVTVRASRSDETAEGTLSVALEVSDTGIGIAPQTVAHLFQPFVQADESMTRRFGGSGLGLSISASIVKALQGDIGLRSEPGVGTTVRVQLPLQLAGPKQLADATRVPARVLLLCADGNPHGVVLRDYLSRVFSQVRQCDPGSRSAPGEALAKVDLLLAVEDERQPCPAAWLEGAPPLLRLRRLEVLTQAGQRYLDDCLPLPLRRQQLLAACRRHLGLDSRVKEPVALSPRHQFRLTCLIVEDNELNRRMIAIQLREYGVLVHEAASGALALDLLAEDAVDLVLLDVHMPEMDGITLAGLIRQRHPQIAVCALTANVIGSEEQALAEAGVREVLYKPIDEARLLTVLARQQDALTPRYAMHLPASVTAPEVSAELQRLAAVVAGLLEPAGNAAAIDAAHQLLGTARMFTRGALEKHCLALEMALRAAHRQSAQHALRCIQRALGVTQSWSSR